jgi:hypothetical protein
MQSYLIPDILQFIFNLYIDSEDYREKLVKVVNFNFNISPHILFRYEIIKDNRSYRLVRDTYVYEILYRREEYYNDEKYPNSQGEVMYQNIYKNEILVEKYMYYYSEDSWEANDRYICNI